MSFLSIMHTFGLGVCQNFPLYGHGGFWKLLVFYKKQIFFGPKISPEIYLLLFWHLADRRTSVL